ncbi:MAG: AAA family ATPase [Bryobacteraceae bacterium]|nr:AAA family ATPase [Bryobacteraceae bacterium]MDW8378540.1 AAA family ATPase [Bryobacterales bacterium]
MGRPELASQSGNWKALIISPNPALLAEFSPLLAQFLPSTPLFEMNTYPERRGLVELSGPQGPNLCFLDLLSDTERALALIGELLGIQPGLKIVVLLSTKDPDTILRAMRQGAAEFLVHPFDPEQLETALARLVSLQASELGAPSRGRVFCVFPAKGACGASTVAANLAHCFKRLGGKKVLLADLDPLTGTVSFLMKLKSSYSFLDALSRSTSLDADVWRGIVTQSGGMDILLSPDTVHDQLHELRDGSLVVEFARTLYDFVIVDAGSVFGEWNLSLARASDDILLVTTNELPALQAAQRSLSYLASNHVNRSRVKLIVNRYSKEYGLSREVIETAMQCDVDHLLPGDYETVQQALLAGKAVAPGSMFGKSVAYLASQLVPELRPKDSGSKKSSALSGLLSLFGRAS